MYKKDILFEFIACGSYMRVHAIDADTGEEVQVTGPIHAPKEYLKKIAMKKLMQQRHSKSRIEKESDGFFC